MNYKKYIKIYNEILVYGTKGWIGGKVFKYLQRE